MLENHQRAAQIPNEPGVAWPHFLRSRFVGRLPGGKADTSLAVVVQIATQQSASHADLGGLVEYGSRSSLPVVFPFTGCIELETREVFLHETNQAAKSFTGLLSENGRVITLRAVSPDGTRSETVHLVHEETLVELGEG